MSRAFSKILVLVILVALAGGGIFAWQYLEIPKGEKIGVIEGSLSYPSDFIPSDMKVCAENVATNKEYCTETHIKDSKYTYGEGYKIEVPPGSYYVFAATQRIPDYKAYYSEFVTCGLNVDCPSHKPIVVIVESGKTITFIDPHDWYKTPERLEEVTEDETADWQTYKNEEYGFEIKYPSDFLISFPTSDFISGGNGLILEIRFTQKKWDQGFSYPSIAIQIFNTNLSAKQWVENEFPISSFPQDEIPYGREEDMTEGEVNGYQFLRFDRVFASGSTQDAVFQNGNILIDIINAIGPNGNNSDVYTQMLSTFRFIEGKTIQDETVDWEIHTKTSDGGDKCSIEYPSDWKIEKVENLTYLTPEEKRILEDIWVYINCFPKEEKYFGVDLRSICPKGEFTLTNREKFEGIHSKEFCILSDDESKIGVVAFQVRHGRQRMDYYIPEKEFEPEFNVFNQMLSTFKFSE